MALGQAPTCPDCRVAGAPRDLWGCDAPVAADARPPFSMACLTCGGMDEGCPACSGRGTVAATRCPSAMFTERPAEAQGVMRFWRAYAPWRAHGVAPEAGGYLDQAATFLRAADIADTEVGRYEREQLERAEREADRTRQAAQRRRGGRRHGSWGQED